MTGKTLVSFEFAPPARPWSTNEDRNLYHMRRHELVTAWKQAARFQYLAATTPSKRVLVPGLVRVRIPFRDKRRRDPHNYCGTVVKAVIDGLVTAGAWPDDTPEWVEHREPVLYRGTMVAVTITAREKEGNQANGYEEVDD